MKTIVVTLFVVLVLGFAVGGRTLLHTAVCEIRDELREYVPDAWQDRMAKEQLDERRSAVANRAAVYNQKLLPRYEGWTRTPMTFEKLCDEQFVPFEKMIAELRMSRQQLSSESSCCESEAQALKRQKQQLDVLIISSTAQLEEMRGMSDEFSELQLLDDRLMAAGTQRDQLEMTMPASDGDPLAETVSYVESLEQKNASQDIEAEFRSRLGGGQTAEDLAALRRSLSDLTALSR